MNKKRGRKSRTNEKMRFCAKCNDSTTHKVNKDTKTCTKCGQETKAHAY